MKAFKVKRGDEIYYRVELPQRLCADGKRHSVMGKTRAETIERPKKNWRAGSAP
jgi:hypothetical protein